MAFLEMVAYSVIHDVGANRWRCSVCPNQDKYTENDIYKHLIDFHEFDKDSLSFHKRDGEIFRKEIEEELEIVVELEDEEGFEEEVSMLDTLMKL